MKTTLKLAKAIEIELETLKTAQGLDESIITVNRILNDARKLAMLVQNEDREAA
jgi:hypothetical protein